MAIKGKELVEKRNILNEVRKNSMSLQELRFFSIYLSKINARDTNTRKVTFPLTDFQKIMELGRVNIKHLQTVTNSLLGKVVNIKNETGGYKAFQLFKECEVYKDEFERWYITIDAHDKALPLMFDFKDRYFTYELWNALRLKSANQLRMYEQLKQFETIGERKITLVELRDKLGIGPDEYPRWDRFRDRVLNSCQQALLENTDIKFTYEPIKSGRKITGVHFHISKNTDYVDQLSLNEFIDQQPNVDDESQITIFDAELEAEQREARENICAGFDNEIFAEFTLEQLEQLKNLAWHNVDGATVDRYYRTYNDLVLSHQNAVADYITQKILLCNTQKDIDTKERRYGFLKKAVAEDWK
jgi:plasmid replication initiation protein